MEKISTVALSVAAASMALLPMSAFAYISPNDVFSGGTPSSGDTSSSASSEQSGESSTAQQGAVNAWNQPAPPTQREGEAVVQAQQKRAAEQRAAEQSQLKPVDAAPQDTYVQTNPTAQPLGLFDQNTQYEKRQERISQDKNNGPTIIIGGDQTIRDSNGNVLHSGAPLVTSTGPESVLALGSMVLAALSTLAYAAIRHRRLGAA
jgi:hypothetical protein